jgi:hypothetical protein
MKFRFTIVGLATGGDEMDVKAWLEHSIISYNRHPQVVDTFNVQLDEVESDYYTEALRKEDKHMAEKAGLIAEVAEEQRREAESQEQLEEEF